MAPRGDMHPVISVTQITEFIQSSCDLSHRPKRRCLNIICVESSAEMGDAMFSRSIWILAFAAVSILGFDIAVSIHDVNAGKSHAFQNHHLSAVYSPVACPTAAARWCQVIGGLPE